MNTLPNIYAGKRVLLTGHTGFKGAWLAEWLLSMGADVTGLALAPNTTPSLFEQLGLAGRLRHNIGDIRDPATVKRVVAEADPDFVFHLAAQPLVRLSYREPVETYATNVMGTVHLLDALRDLQARRSTSPSSHPPTSQPYSLTPSQPPYSTATPVPARPCAAVFVTTDKCYANRGILNGYREDDPMGGYDPYSSSKGCAELAISSFRDSYFNPGGKTIPLVGIASARAGNVIGGGDWAEDRIVPDCMRRLARGEPVPVRNPHATRPWQHVLEPLGGYLLLGARLHEALAAAHGISPVKPSNLQTRASGAAQTFKPSNHSLTASQPYSLSALASAFNFGPNLPSNQTVRNLVEEVLRHWPGSWVDQSDPHAPHEAHLLNLAVDKAFHLLGWQPAWDFQETVRHTVEWYRAVHGGADPRALTADQIRLYANH